MAVGAFVFSFFTLSLLSLDRKPFSISFGRDSFQKSKAKSLLPARRSKATPVTEREGERERGWLEKKTRNVSITRADDGDDATSFATPQLRQQRRSSRCSTFIKGFVPNCIRARGRIE